MIIHTKYNKARLNDYRLRLGVALAASPSFTTPVTYAFESTGAAGTGDDSALAVAPPDPALISEALGSVGVSVPASWISTVAPADSDPAAASGPTDTEMEDDADESGGEREMPAQTAPKSTSSALVQATASVVSAQVVFGAWLPSYVSGL